MRRSSPGLARAIDAASDVQAYGTCRATHRAGSDSAQFQRIVFVHASSAADERVPALFIPSVGGRGSATLLPVCRRGATERLYSVARAANAARCHAERVLRAGSSVRSPSRGSGECPWRCRAAAEALRSRPASQLPIAKPQIGKRTGCRSLAAAKAERARPADLQHAAAQVAAQGLDRADARDESAIRASRSIRPRPSTARSRRCRWPRRRRRQHRAAVRRRSGTIEPGAVARPAPIRPIE